VPVATDRDKEEILTLQISAADLNALVDVLKTCADDFCADRHKNALDLRMQYLRMSALRDAITEPPPTRRDRNSTPAPTYVDPRAIPNRPPEKKDW
jgi:hypothetical protein